MKYAIIRSGGKQYKVREGEEILVDKLFLQKGNNYIFPEILLIRDREKIMIGDPLVRDGKVSGEVIDQIKGDKVIIAKFKAKVHYRRKSGFRPFYTKILIKNISTGNIESKKKTAKSSKSEKSAPKKQE